MAFPEEMLDSCLRRNDGIVYEIQKADSLGVRPGIVVLNELEPVCDEVQDDSLLLATDLDTARPAAAVRLMLSGTCQERLNLTGQTCSALRSYCHWQLRVAAFGR